MNGIKIRYNGLNSDYCTEIQNGVLQTRVPTGISHAFQVDMSNIMTISSTGVSVTGNLVVTDSTFNNNVICNNGLTFPRVIGTKITYYTGYYTDIFQGPVVIALRNVVPSGRYFIFKVGDNEQVKIDASYTTINNSLLQIGSNYIEQYGAGTNIFKTSTFNGNVQIKLNIDFSYTTLSIPSPTELGHVRTAITLTSPAFVLSPNIMYNCASAILDIGVWSVTFQVCYKQTAASGTTSRFDYGLSTTSAIFDNSFIDMQVGGFHTTNEFRMNRTTRTFTVTTGTLTIYAVIRLAFSSGTYQTGGVTIGTSNFISMQAVRIA